MQFTAGSSHVAMPLRGGNAWRTLGLGLLIFAIALAIRWLRSGQSLWCDEMSTFLDYVIAPWSKGIAPGRGEYVPNDHVLFTILDKLVYQFVGTGETAAGRSVPSERLIRLPSLVAGAFLPIALAWPFRRTAPLFAFLLAVLACVHPWLVVFSTEARGYSLMLLLGVLATYRLPVSGLRWPWLYSILMAAMLYTVPVGLLLLAAHGVAMGVVRRDAMGAWLRGVLLAAVLTLLLYLPIGRGILAYYHHPLPAPDDYVDFVNQLPRFALAGEYLPHPADLLSNRPDPWVGWICWAAPMGIFAVGSFFAWKQPDLHLILLALAAPLPVACVVALFFHSTGQVRFVPWSALWICLTIAGILLEIHRRAGTIVMSVGLLGVVGWMLHEDLTMPPSQPIRDAFVRVDDLTPAGRPVVDALLTAPQAVALYGPLVRHHPLIAAATIPDFLTDERQILTITGSRPDLIMSYEYLARDLQPSFWSYINQHYRLIARLPGRLSAVSIYEPVE